MNSSTSERIISEGRLSTQKYPSSSKAAIAVDLPAPEYPVMITRSVRADVADSSACASGSSGGVGAGRLTPIKLDGNGGRAALCASMAPVAHPRRLLALVPLLGSALALVL